MPFKKGQSGNPGGRPKGQAEVRDLARQHGVEAVRRLIELLRADNERIAISAAIALLDRGFGKPLQQTELSGRDGGSLDFRDLSDAQLNAKITVLLSDKALMESIGPAILAARELA